MYNPLSLHKLVLCNRHNAHLIVNCFQQPGPSHDLMEVFQVWTASECIPKSSSPGACLCLQTLTSFPVALWPPSFNHNPGTIAEKYGPQTPGTKMGFSLTWKSNRKLRWIKVGTSQLKLGSYQSPTLRQFLLLHWNYQQKWRCTGRNSL